MKRLVNKLYVLLDIVSQFGVKYLILRLIYETLKKAGVLKYFFPTKLSLNRDYPNLTRWRNEYSDRFFIPGREKFDLKGLKKSDLLRDQTEMILDEKILFFFNEWKKLGFNEEWNVHPVSGYKYPVVHWTKIPIYSKEIGDIKYVWEKSKFSYLLYIIRNDAINKEDHSEFVFQEIDRWIESNPPNIGPQYVCSQEISIRLLNWIFALFFYQNSIHLTDNVFNKLIASIEIQLDHIYNNIFFSKNFVRNNHAITETLTLYLVSSYFPFLKNSVKYKSKGKKWFEKEVKFQIFKDGSDSQYSFNYHRVKIQLFSWALATAKINNDSFDLGTITRMRKSVEFLYQMMANYKEGLLPNFGANDGSIYFKLNDNDYQNYHPQLYALSRLLNYNLPSKLCSGLIKEDLIWFSQKIRTLKTEKVELKELAIYPDGGYIQYKKDENVLLFKTPQYKFRVGQDDYMHIDLWINGKNYLKDSGSFSYSAEPALVQFFNGALGHNTVTIKGYNHLLKGDNFIWLYKPVKQELKYELKDDKLKICSKMKVFYPFRYVLMREILYNINNLDLQVVDCIMETKFKKIELEQIWNLDKKLNLKITAFDNDNNLIDNTIMEGYHSKYYGTYEKGNKMVFLSGSNKIKTIIQG